MGALAQSARRQDAMLQAALSDADEKEAHAAGYFLAQLPAQFNAYLWAAVAAFVRNYTAQAEHAPRMLSVLHSFARHTPYGLA